MYQIMKKILYTYVFLFSLLASAQVKDSLPSFSDEYYLIRDGDSLTIQLDEIAVLPKHKFKSRKDAHYYYWFRKKVFKAYPYAVLASKRLDSVEARLQNVKSKRKKRQYVKRVQSYVEKELTDQLKKMTRTEGRVLIKLIHRQTGETAFENIRELRSGWKAFWYNTTASAFDISLKKEFDPFNNEEDYLIEDILQRSFQSGILDFQDTALGYEYLELTNKWKPSTPDVN